LADANAASNGGASIADRWRAEYGTNARPAVIANPESNVYTALGHSFGKCHSGAQPKE